MTPEQAAALQPDDVIEWRGELHRIGSVQVDAVADGGPVVKVSARSLTADRWLPLLPYQVTPGSDSCSFKEGPCGGGHVCAFHALAAARLVEQGQRGLMLMGDWGRPPGVPARPVNIGQEGQP